MILGVGIDIIEVKRLEEKILKGNGFREKVFSTAEIEYCEHNATTKYQHYAARFAAKEAFLKASGKGLQLSHELNQIAVQINKEGKPDLLVNETILNSISTEKINIHVSLSHLEETACAVVVLETK